MGVLKDVSLKQARELAPQWYSVLRQRRSSIKEHNQQKICL